jgi:hypothetical protein
MSSLLEQASLIVTPNAFKAGKLYSIKPTDGSGDLDVVRATTATRVNSAGLIESVANNVPRLDYTNGSCPSILVEPQRTNLLTYSEQFDNAAWGKFNTSITPNITTAPDGTITADKIIATIVNNFHITSQGALLTSGVIYTQTYFVKSDEFQFVQIGSAGPSLGTGNINFDLQNEIITSINGFISGSIEKYNNEWYRIRATKQAISTGLSSMEFNLIQTSNAIQREQFAGNGTDGVFIWGAQLEAGSNATSYIPTVASAVTRNADVISKTGISDLIGQSEGTLYWEGRIVGGIATDLFIIGNIANSVFFNITSTNQLRVGIRANSALIAGFFSSALSVTNFKIAIAYKSGDIVAYVNGVQVSTNSTTFTFNASVNEIEIGRQFFDPKATQFMTQALLFKTRLTNAELANLTTL